MIMELAYCESAIPQGEPKTQLERAQGNARTELESFLTSKQTSKQASNYFAEHSTYWADDLHHSVQLHRGIDVQWNQLVRKAQQMVLRLSACRHHRHGSRCHPWSDSGCTTAPTPWHGTTDINGQQVTLVCWFNVLLSVAEEFLFI